MRMLWASAANGFDTHTWPASRATNRIVASFIGNFIIPPERAMVRRVGEPARWCQGSEPHGSSIVSNAAAQLIFFACAAHGRGENREHGEATQGIDGGRKAAHENLRRGAPAFRRIDLTAGHSSRVEKIAEESRR